MSRVKGQVVAKNSRGIATLQMREQPPCGACGRRTYRLNAAHTSMCGGCDEDSIICTCKSLDKIGTQLVG